MSSNQLLAVLSYAGIKGANLKGAVNDVTIATARTILHNDGSLFKATTDALASNGGQTKSGDNAKNHKGDVLGRLKAAWLAAGEARTKAFPDGRKGKPTADDIALADIHAVQIAEAFKDACEADVKTRADASTEKAAATKASKKLTEEIKALETDLSVIPDEEKEVVTYRLPFGLDLVTRDDGLIEAFIVDGVTVALEEFRAIVAEREAVKALEAITANAA